MMLNPCEGCGKCCEVILLAYSGQLNDEFCKARRLSKYNGPLGDFMIIHYPCPHYDEKTNLCTIYDSRPATCRQFPVNCKECRICKGLKRVSPSPLPKSV